MFRKIRTRLVLWNALVFFIVLAVVGFTFLVNLRHHLYDNLDAETTLQVQPAVQMIKDGTTPPVLFDGPGRRGSQGLGMRMGLHAPLGLILWSDNGQRLSKLPDFTDAAQERVLFAMAKEASSGFLEMNGQQVRVLNIKIPSLVSQRQQVLTVLRNTQDIAGVLHESQWVVALGVMMGAVVSILAALFQASRALVPIRRSWDKQVQFVADASHELRTPILTISANAELLLREPDSTVAAKAETISGILKEARRLNRLVTHLLTLARSDSHLLELDKKQLDLSLVLEQVTEQFRPLCEVKSLTLTGDFEPLVTVIFDEERIRQLLLILLDNAQKYTNPGGAIHVSSRVHSRKVEVSVADTGCGIAHNQLPHIFDRFYRGEKSRSDESKSAGLGLSIAEWIVFAHKGTIDVKSEVGQGTTFTVRLPLR